MTKSKSGSPEPLREKDMDFDIELFVEKSAEKIGHIREIEIEYVQSGDCEAQLVITAFNGMRPAKFGDFNGEIVMKFRFGNGVTDDKYLESKSTANSIKAYLQKNYSGITVYRSTKCRFAWFG